MSEQGRHHDTRATSRSTIVAACIIAVAVGAAAIYIAHCMDSAPSTDVTQADDADQACDEQACPAREDRFRQQTLAQLRNQAKVVRIIDVRDIRFTHNDKAAAFDLTYAAAEGQSQQTAVIELTEDEKGRYQCAFSIGPDKFSLVVY